MDGRSIKNNFIKAKAVSKILVVARGSLSSQAYTPSRSIFCRVYEPLAYLEQHAGAPLAVDVLKTNEVREDNIGNYHTVIFCKHNTEDSIRVLHLAQKVGARIIYDIDDLIHRFTEDSAAFIYMKNLNYCKEHIEAADVVVASTAALKAVIENDFVTKNTIVIRTGINTDKYSKAEYRPLYSTVLFTNGDNIKINSFREDFLTVFNQFLQQHQEIDFKIFGDSEQYMENFARYQFLGSLPWDKHKIWLMKNQVEFSIIPLGSAEEDPVHQLFSDCKTPIKYLEYGATRIPGIYSNASIYREVIQHRETGLLVDNTAAAWISALEELHEDVSLRKKLAQNAYDDVVANHHIRIAASKWRDIL